MESEKEFQAKRDDAIGDVLVYTSQLGVALDEPEGFVDLAGDVGTRSHALANLFCLTFDVDRTRFLGMTHDIAAAAGVSVAHAKLCFVETARKVMKRTDRTETRETV
jgi:hypothetical protein